MSAIKIHDELLRQGVALVAVTKNQSAERVRELYDSGLRNFGENRVQELLDKHDALPKDIHWHLIGHLQTNKVKQIAPFVHLIQSVDSEKLLQEISRQAVKQNRVIDYLLQVRVAKEETKFGLTEKDFLKLFNDTSRNLSAGLVEYKNVRVRGLMVMATNTDDENQIRSEFGRAKELFDTLKQKFPTETSFAKVDTLSMGMSSDYKIAIECGSNMARIGSLLFDNQTEAV
jgi:pyridoxal phosphate enzyme (YggS family)